MASSYLISTAVSQVSYTQADIDGIIKSARHTLVESDSAPGEISHLVVCKQGSPDWKKSQEIWLRTNLQLLPGYPSSFVMAPTEEQIFYPVFCDRKFAGRFCIKGIRYLEPESPEVHSLVACKYKNPKKRAVFVRQSFAIVTMAGYSSEQIQPETGDSEAAHTPVSRDHSTSDYDTLKDGLKSLYIGSSNFITSGELLEKRQGPKGLVGGVHKPVTPIRSREGQARPGAGYAKNLSSKKGRSNRKDLKEEEPNLGLSMGWGYRTQF